jgi:hypothetical protein
MQNILRVLEESSIFHSMREDFKRTVKEILKLREEEISALAEIEQCKGKIDESRYAKLLEESKSKDELNDNLARQYSWRALFVNSVLRCHEARLGLAEKVDAIERGMKRLGKQDEQTAVLALVALRHLVDSVRENDAATILAELDSLNGIDRDSLFEAVQAVFQGKKSKSGLFADCYITARMLPLRTTKWWQDELLVAVNSAIAVREELDVRWEKFIHAGHNANLRLFTKALESAILEGDLEKVERVRRERKVVQANLFVSATHYKSGMDMVAQEDVALQAAFDKAAKFIDEKDLSIENLKAMTNALGAWLWLGELRLYIVAKYNSENVPQILQELAFDASSYLTA